MSTSKENETEQVKKTEQTKTQVYNVIILDKSGSMDCIRHAAVSGFNETLASIKQAQEKFAETQDHFVTLVAFCSCETKTIMDNIAAKDAQPLKTEDYTPCCCTPLYDAMGFTLTKIQKHVEGIDDAAVIVTIITDGLENASKEYNSQSIKSLVERLKGRGWAFTYMGANQDSVEVAMNISIRNARNFDYSEEGTVNAMRSDSSTRRRHYAKLNKFNRENHNVSVTERLKFYSNIANEAFDEEENK